MENRTLWFKVDDGPSVKVRLNAEAVDIDDLKGLMINQHSYLFPQPTGPALWHLYRSATAGEPEDSWTLVTELKDAGNTGPTALVLRRVTPIVAQRPAFVRSRSNQKFIDENNVRLNTADGLNLYMEHLFGNYIKLSGLPKPEDLKFNDNCLEYRLDRRSTDYMMEQTDNIKICLAVSGAGKTRMLLELLNSNDGYYFTVKSSQDDFGSKDMFKCQVFCDYHPDKCERTIKLLYFVRISVCNYLRKNGYTKPSDILFAQLHPLAFFKQDVFADLFDILLDETDLNLTFNNAFSFVAIDECQVALESVKVHQLPGSEKKRSFFSPLVYYSKDFFLHFFLSGTGINFGIMKEALESFVIKEKLKRKYEVLSGFHALSVDEIVNYSTWFLEEHSCDAMELNDIVEKIVKLPLCHGRPRFLTFILDRYLETGDIDGVIDEFIEDVTDINGNTIPLRFLKSDLDNGICSFKRVLGKETLLNLVCNGMLGFMISGKFSVHVPDEEAAQAVRYGLGFGTTEKGVFDTITIQELAVFHCLRYFVPVDDVIQQLCERVNFSPNPQTVGYLTEYLVGFAFVKKYGGENELVTVFKGSPGQYLLNGSKPGEVCYPDHMCGPDIIYKSKQHKKIYIVQVKFLKDINVKKTAAAAMDTTDPQKFYHKRKVVGKLTGKLYDEKRRNWSKFLDEMVSNGLYKVEQVLFIHTKKDIKIAGVRVISQAQEPDFFYIREGISIWNFLDSVRSKLNELKLYIE